MMLWVLAHQGGWDEALYIAVPALALLYALRHAEKRARANAERRKAEQEVASEPSNAHEDPG